MTYNVAFKRNISGLQKMIEFLGSNIDSSENKELLQNALREYRLWVRMFLDYKDRLNEKPKESKEEIYAKVIKTMKNAKIPLKYIVRFEKELREKNRLRKLSKYEA